MITTFSLFPAVTKPGKCPTFVTPDHPTPCARPTDFCRHDGDCPGNEKCCRRTFCGGYVCGSPEPGAPTRQLLIVPINYEVNLTETWLLLNGNTTMFVVVDLLLLSSFVHVNGLHGYLSWTT